MKILLLAFVLCLIAFPVYGEETESQKRYAKSIEDEIVRNHELKMAEKEIEVLGRLEMLGASKTYVSQGTSVAQGTFIKSETKNIEK